MSTQENYIIIYSFPFETVIWKVFFLGRNCLPHHSFLDQIHSKFPGKTNILNFKEESQLKPCLLLVFLLSGKVCDSFLNCLSSSLVI